MNPTEMTGLQIMQAFAQGRFPTPGIAKIIPMKPESVERGRVTFTASADATHTNPLGGVHGGFAATVLDSVTGCAAHTMLEAGERYGTLDLNVKMVKPIPFGKALRAEGRVLHHGKKVVIAEGDIRDAEGTLYAFGTATCMISR